MWRLFVGRPSEDDQSDVQRNSRRQKLQQLQRDRVEEERRRTVELEKARQETRVKRLEQEMRRRQLEEERQLCRRAEQLERELSKYNVHRMLPLGQDRHFNTYWFFDGVGSGAYAAGCGAGRLFVQMKADDSWASYSDPGEIDLLLQRLNPKGERERQLKKTLARVHDRITAAVARRHQDILTNARQEDVRRSDRIKTAPKHSSSSLYQNKWRANL